MSNERDFRIPEPKLESTVAHVPQDYFPWGVSMIGAKDMWDAGYRGKGICIAILDTGIDYNHKELKGKVVDGKSFVSDDYMDDHYHGTHVAGIAAGKGKEVPGVAPDAELLAVKVLDEEGQGDLESVIQGIDWAVENGTDIINMSLGSLQGHDDLEKAIQRAVDHGVMVVAAAGNHGDPQEESSDPHYPAWYDEAVSVSAICDEQEVADFSARGKVEISGPGVKVYAPILNDRYGYLSGTSMACPHVAGAVALLLQKARERLKDEDVTLNSLLNHMYMNSVDLGDSGWDPKYGHGLLSFNDAKALKDKQRVVQMYIKSKPEEVVRTVYDGVAVMRVDGEQVVLDVPPEMREEQHDGKLTWRTMLPVRPFAEALGCKVDWEEEGDTHIVTIRRG